MDTIKHAGTAGTAGTMCYLIINVSKLQTISVDDRDTEILFTYLTNRIRFTSGGRRVAMAVEASA